MRHWHIEDPMVLVWLLAGQGWQAPSPDWDLKVPWPQAVGGERESVFRNIQQRPDMVTDASAQEAEAGVSQV